MKEAIEHYKRAKVLSEGDNIFVKRIELSLIEAEAECEKSGEKDERDHHQSMKEKGDSFWSGVKLAKALKSENQVIEAQRLIADLVANCRRVHGPDHPNTLWAEDVQEEIIFRKFTIGNAVQMYDY